MVRAQPASPRWSAVLLAAFFVSGFTALVYEVLWMRALRLLLGSGAQAAATTLAVYFTGLAAGSALFGRRASSSRRPLAMYGRLELAIAATALLFFVLPCTDLWIEPTRIVARGAIAFVLLLPPAVLMGGTLPAMGEVLVRAPRDLAATTGTLYAVNTAGAALGALAAGFWLPATLGVRGSYVMAIALNVGLASVALALAGRVDDGRPRTPAGSPAWIPGRVAVYAFVAGFATLALEVLWTRMLALVLNGSVYAFAAILTVFLLALALGGLVSARLAARLSPALHVFLLLLGASLTVGASPFVLQVATRGLGSVPGAGGFAAYVLLTFGLVIVVILPAATLCGAVLPSLLRDVAHGFGRPGAIIGRVVAINTAGGVVGALGAGFVLLPRLGLWRSLSVLALLYAGLALFAVRAHTPGGRPLRAAALTAGALLATLLDPTRLPLLRTEPGEVVRRIWETPRGIVAVTEDANGRRIRVDNTYVLGGTEGRAEEELQAELPLALHGRPRRVFFLGLGTGITAAAALRHPVERVTVAELLPEVVEASREYFAEATGGLHADPRAEVVAADGRLLLASTPDPWDVIVSDLFVPWHDGTAALYSREQFALVRDRLAPGGLFVQWLPLFQLTRSEFDTVVRTLVAVFDNVELWYADLRGGEAIAALAAWRDARPGPDRPVRVNRAVRVGGNLATLHPLFDAAPIQTADVPVLEHLAPRSLARVRSGRATWLVGAELERLVRDVESASDHPDAAARNP